jgi:uncharacterized membrane protein
MRADVAFVTGLGAGAAVMLLLDPSQGARRRARTRDKLVRAAHNASRAMGATARDLGHRAQGMAATIRHTGRAEFAENDVLVERVRARLGRHVSHPRAIEVHADSGVVTLVGPILAREHARLVAAVRSVRGVRDIEDHLEPHEEAGNIPSLQGGVVPPGESFELWQRRWTPSVRLLVGAMGGTVCGWGMVRRDATGLGLALLGTAVTLRAASNLEAARLVGIGAGRRAIDIHKTMDIAAPVARVAEVWSGFERFPEFLSRVTEVRRTRAPHQWHWTILGPAGVPLQFDAIVTEFIPDAAIAWRTTRSSAIRHAGLVRFDPAPGGSTRVTVRMSYHPPGGAIGHSAAALVGADLKQLLDEELLRMKTYIETGRPPHDAAQRSGDRGRDKGEAADRVPPGSAEAVRPRQGR